MLPVLDRSHFKTAVVAAVATLCVSCSSAHKRAQKLLNEGLFDDAVVAYSALLEQDPKDEDALIGRKKAREGWIDRKLIDVRLSRMGGNANEAINRLLDIVEKEKQWGLSPGGKVAFTQGEERDYAILYSERVVNSALIAKQPLAAHVWLNRYAAILEGVPDARVARLREMTRQKGTESCQPLRSSAPYASRPNLDRILRQYCELWGVTQWPKLPARSLRAPYYFGSIGFRSALEGFRPNSTVYIEDQLRRALEASACYEAGLEHPLPLRLSGRYGEEHKSEQIGRTKVYSEDVPYTERVQVEKTRSVPYTETVGNKVISSARTEKYMDWETVTRHRTAYHEYRYLVTRKEQTLSIALQGAFDFDGETGSIARNDRSEAFGFEHDENHPSIGVKPERADLPDPDGWIRQRADALAAEFKGKLGERWQELFCKVAPANTGLLEAGEMVALCLRHRHPKAPEFTQQWFRTHFGTTAEEALVALRYP